MASHEKKICPRCQSVFECKVGNIIECQCYAVQLNEDERRKLDGTYHDCVCAACLVDLKNDVTHAPEPAPH